MSAESSGAAFAANAALETFDLAFPGSGTVLGLAFASLFGGGGGAPPRDYWTRWSYDPPHGVWHHDQSAANSPNAATMDQAVSALVLSTARNVRYLSFNDPAFYFFVSIAMGDTGGGSWQVSSNWTLKTNGSFDPATGGDNSFAYQSGAIPETQVQNALTLAAYGVIRQEVMSGHIARIEALDYLFQLPAEQMDPATAKANIQAAVRQAAIYRAKVIGNNSLPALIGVDNGVPATWTAAPPAPPPAPAPANNDFSYSGTFERNCILVSGRQFIGVPFKPSLVKFNSIFVASQANSAGIDNGVTAQCRYTTYEGGTGSRTDASIFMIATSSGNGYMGRIGELAENGFFIDWTRISDCSGLLQVSFTATRETVSPNAPAPTVAETLVAQAAALGINADPGALVSAFTQYANGPASMLNVPPVTAPVPQVTPALPLVPVVAAPPPPAPAPAMPAWVTAAALVGLFAFVGKKGRPRHV